MSSAILTFRKSSLALSQFHHAADATLWLSYFLWCVHAKLLQLCLTLYDPMDCSPPGSSVHGVLQASILEWVAVSLSGGSSRPRDQTHVSYVSCIDRRVLYHQCHLGSPGISLPVAKKMDAPNLESAQSSLSAGLLTTVFSLDQVLDGVYLIGCSPVMH